MYILCLVPFYFGFRNMKRLSTKDHFPPFSSPTDTLLYVTNPDDGSVPYVSKQLIITTGPPGHAPAQPVLHSADLAAKQCTQVRTLVLYFALFISFS